MQNNTEIEINLIIDDRPEHYAYCDSIDEAIKTLQNLKRKGKSVIEGAFDRYIFMLDAEKKPLELYEKDIEILNFILGTSNIENYKGHEIIIKKENREESQDNNFKLDEICFKEVSGRSDLEKFLKKPESYIFNSQKTGKPWSKEASQKIIRCRFCEYNKIGTGLRPCYSCKYNIKAEEVKEYEE